MNTFQTVLRAFLEAQRGKEAARLRWRTVKFGQEGYDKTRSEFLLADSTSETLFGEMTAMLTAARNYGELAELFDSLSEEDVTQLRLVMSERGLMSLLAAEPNSFAEMVRHMRRTSALWTAFKQLNRRRNHCIATGEFVAEDCPANLDERTWRAAGASLKRRIEEMREQYPEASLEDIAREAVYELENKARLAYDKSAASLVTAMQRLIESGSLDLEISELDDPELKRAARDFISHVPMPHRQTQPKTDRRY
jgi:hypothetical protein